MNHNFVIILTQILPLLLLIWYKSFWQHFYHAKNFILGNFSLTVSCAIFKTVSFLQITNASGRSSGIVARRVGCCIKGPGFESRIRHGCHTVRSWTHQWLRGSAPKTGRREVPGSFLDRACGPSRSEFFMVFFETGVNMDYCVTITSSTLSGVAKSADPKTER